MGMRPRRLAQSLRRLPLRPTSFCSALLTSILLCTAYTHAQESVAGDKRAAVDASLQRMRADTWQQRSVGFYQLLRAQLRTDLDGQSRKIPPAVRSLMREVPDRADQMAVGLIDALRRENDVSTSARTTDEFASYHGDLAVAVGALGDKRALPVLVDILERGDIAMKGVARLGASTALAPLTNLAAAPSDPKRNAAMRTLGLLLDPTINPEPVTADQRANIKAALVGATTDPNPFVRMSAVEGLSRLLPDPDVSGLLRRLSKSDPYSTIDESGMAVFPVRQTATRALLLQEVPKK
jgi:HEAT repeat protein